MHHARPRDALQLNHSQAQALLLDYCYGRLSHAEDAALEAHVARCPECRAEGARHVAAERARALQQRARQHQRKPTRGLAVLASILLGALAGLSLYIIVGTARARQEMHGQTQGTLTVLPSPRPSRPPGPVTLRPLGTIPAPNVAALAWSPDGTILATAAAPQGNDPGGVMLLTQSATGTLAKRLAGFENVTPPSALAWSPDGTELAAGGGAHLFIWNVATSRVVTTIALPFAPLTNLYVFDATTGALVMSAPSSIFAPTGSAEWLPGGHIQSAQQVAPNTLSLWHSSGGIRIFHDPTSGAVEIGQDDADVQAHAAFIRWSPDGRYLLWGYPRLPIVAHAPPSGALASPDAALAAFVHAVGATNDPASSILLWPAPDGTRYAALDGTRAVPRIALYDAKFGMLRATISLRIPANVPPGMLAWQPGATPALGVAASAAGVTRFTAGG